MYPGGIIMPEQGGAMITVADEKKRHFILNVAYLAVVFTLVWFVIHYLIGWVLPFLVGYLIAAMVQPVVYFLYKKLRFNRRYAGIFTVLVFVFFLGLLLALCITKSVEELAAVFRSLPSLLSRLSSSLKGISVWISNYVDTLPVEVSERIADSLGSLQNELMKLSSLSSGALSFAYNIITGVPGLLFKTVVAIISACFISMDYLDIRGFILRQLSKKHQSWVLDIKSFFFTTIAKLLRAYLTLMAITFVELSIGLSILRIPHAVIIAVFIALVDILPVLGTGTVMIPWAIIEMITGDVTMGLSIGVLYGVITLIRNIIEPKLVGYHIGLHPLVTLMAMFIGLSVMGVPGMFLFPITLIILKHMQDTGKIRIWKD